MFYITYIEPLLHIWDDFECKTCIKNYERQQEEIINNSRQKNKKGLLEQKFKEWIFKFFNPHWATDEMSPFMDNK